MSIKVEKTHFLTIDGKQVLVSSLPDSIKDQVKVFDELRQDLMDQTYKLNVYQLATEQKKLQLEQLLKEYIESEQKDKESEKSISET
jgi:hypothetical protein